MATRAYCCWRCVGRVQAQRLAARLHLGPVVGVVHVGDVHPGVRHLVDRAIAVAHPHVGIGVGAVGRGVVVPPGDLQDGALGQQRRRVLFVDVGVVPVEVEFRHVAEHLGAAVGKDRLDRHRLAAQVHVRLEALDAAVLAHHEVALGGLDRVGRDVDAAGVGGAHQVEHLTELRLLALRVEVDAQLDLVGDVLAAVRVVDVPHHLRARQHQLAAARPHHLALLADGPFHEGARQRVAVGIERIGGQVIGLLLLQAGDGVVGDLAALHRGGAHLDGPHPARLGEPGGHDRLPPRVVLRRPSASTAPSG